MAPVRITRAAKAAERSLRQRLGISISFKVMSAAAGNCARHPADTGPFRDFSRSRRLTERSTASHCVQNREKRAALGLVAVTRCRHVPQSGGWQSEFALERSIEGGQAVEAPTEGDVGDRSAGAGRARESGAALQ
jgi:hypothetical protein